MDITLLLAKSITLLYCESLLRNKSENSADLVRSALDNISIPNISIGLTTIRDVSANLYDTAIEMCNNSPDHEYDLVTLTQRIRLNCSDNKELADDILSGIRDDRTEEQIKKTILNLRRSINTHLKEQKIGDILKKASDDFRYNRAKIRDIDQFKSDLTNQLDKLIDETEDKDPAIISNIDIGDENDVSKILQEIKDTAEGRNIMQTGFRELNEMLQGGFRAGELVTVHALPHNYKTGFTLSIFKGLALYNKPILQDPSKKPLLLRISFEDDLNLNIQFLYQSLMYDETNRPVSIKNTPVKEMADYIRHRLQVNGFYIKMMRVDPSQWTYKHICNKVTDLEAEGYEINTLMLDYLGMIPRIGCTTTGPSGTDLRDMFRRMRNFCSTRKITLITPHQLSTESKQLLRGGIPEDQFVKTVNGKGYYAECKQLDHEIDVELYIHIVRHKKEYYLSVQRGKHRIPSIIPEELRYFLLKFPKGMPIPDNINNEHHTVLRELPTHDVINQSSLI